MPAPELIRYVVAAGLVAALAAAAIIDMRQRRIPNWTVLMVLGLFVVWTASLTGHGLGSSLAAAGIAALVTIPLYAFRIVGAGDSKLLMAVALFAGLADLPMLGLATALGGGALAIVTFAANPVRTLVILQMRGQGGSQHTVPYGVAIALGGMTVLSSKFGWTPEPLASLLG